MIERCFTPSGQLKFDPYRTDRGDENYKLLFNNHGELKDRTELARLIIKNSWSLESDAVALFHSSVFASNTKGNYPTVYYWR